MKHKHFSLILALMTVVCTSCDLAMPIEIGDVCPPEGENGQLVYISKHDCNADACELGDFAQSFEQGFCPKAYPLCRTVGKSIDGVAQYYCDVQKEIEFACADTALDCTACEDCDQKCISRDSQEYCGANSCDKANYGGDNCSNYGALATCQFNEVTKSYACACVGGAAKCGSQCVDLLTDNLNCGDCGNTCEGSERCMGGECKATGCPPTQCPNMNVTPVECVNSDSACGGACANCKNLHDNGVCFDLLGMCVISSCNAGEHPIYKDSHIVKCEKNSPTSCAPSNAKMDDAPVDCTQITGVGILEMGCSDAGECVVAKCEPGFARSSDGKSCTASSASSCGKGSDGRPIDCYESIKNSASVECVSDACVLVACNENYHMSSDGKRCVQNTTTQCGRPDSYEVEDCSSKFSGGYGKCGAAGECLLESCSANYHMAPDNRSCRQNTTEECGPVNSHDTQNCRDLVPSGGSVICSGGQCVIQTCPRGSHLGSGTGEYCVKNTNTECAPPHRSGVLQLTDCTRNSYAKVCDENGECACSTDGSKVVNYDGNACVPKVCMGFPGVKTGHLDTKSRDGVTSDYRCVADSCTSGYELYKGICSPTGRTQGQCNDMGYVRQCGGKCVAMGSNCSSYVSHDKCMEGYREVNLACIEDRYCCGTRNPNYPNLSDYLCTNCVAQGYSGCNTGTGRCI